MIDDDSALLHLHPRRQMMLRPLQRFRRHRCSAAGHGHGDVLVRHPKRGQSATHAIEAGLQDLRKFVRVARRSLIGGDLHHQLEIALFDVQIALAGAQLGAQRQLAAQALEGGLHQLADGLQRARLDLGSRQPNDQTHDTQQFNVLAAYGEGINHPVRIDGSRDARKLGGIGQGIGDRVVDELRLVAQVPLIGSPHKVGIAIVNDHAAQARHEHAQQSAVRVERGLGMRFDDVRLDIQH